MSKKENTTLTSGKPIWVRTETDWSNRYGLGRNINIIVTLEYLDKPWRVVHTYLHNPATGNTVCIHRGPETLQIPKTL